MSHLTLTAVRGNRRPTTRVRTEKLAAESMLRDIAYVLQLTQRVKAETLGCTLPSSN